MFLCFSEMIFRFFLKLINVLNQFFFNQCF